MRVEAKSKPIKARCFNSSFLASAKTVFNKSNFWKLNTVVHAKVTALTSNWEVTASTVGESMRSRYRHHVSQPQLPEVTIAAKII